MELSPNEMYAALVAVAGYVPVTLCGDDYIELLPVCWRAVNDDGIRIDYRTYDSAELGPYRRRPSPASGKRGLWEVHYDPYDVSRVWPGALRAASSPPRGLTCPSREPLSPTSPGARPVRVAAARGEDPCDQAALARVVDDILHRAGTGPGPADRAVARTVARDRSAATLPLRPVPEVPPPDAEDRAGATVVPITKTEPATSVVPFGVFDPDARRRLRVTSATGDDIREPLTTKEGWARFVDAEPVAAPDLTPQERDEARAAYEEARLDYHTQLAVVATPAIRQVTSTGRRLMLLNRHQVSARSGPDRDRPDGHRQDHRGHPARPWPRALCPAPPPRRPRPAPRGLRDGPASGHGPDAGRRVRPLPRPAPLGRSNQADVTNAVCGVLCDLRTDLVIVDEIHNLNLATRAGAEVSDQLKYFSERIPATFVYAGIDVSGGGMFGGTRGRQIAGRFATLPTTAFGYTNAAQREQWQALVATLEGALRLRRHKPGTLVRLDAYLHDRTDGMIGSLSHLIRGAAIEAILDGSEAITKATLDGVHLDHAAERARKSRCSTGSSGHKVAS